MVDGCPIASCPTSLLAATANVTIAAFMIFVCLETRYSSSGLLHVRKRLHKTSCFTVLLIIGCEHSAHAPFPTVMTQIAFQCSSNTLPLGPILAEKYSKCLLHEHSTGLCKCMRAHNFLELAGTFARELCKILFSKEFGIHTHRNAKDTFHYKFKFESFGCSLFLLVLFLMTKVLASSWEFFDLTNLCSILSTPQSHKSNNHGKDQGYPQRKQCIVGRL